MCIRDRAAGSAVCVFFRRRALMRRDEFYRAARWGCSPSSRGERLQQLVRGARCRGGAPETPPVVGYGLVVDTALPHRRRRRMRGSGRRCSICRPISAACSAKRRHLSFTTLTLTSEARVRPLSSTELSTSHRRSPASCLWHAATSVQNGPRRDAPPDGRSPRGRRPNCGQRRSTSEFPISKGRISGS